MKTLIFRIENKDGNGFFHDDNIKYRQRKNLNKPPCPSEDIGIHRGMTKKEKCGFLNLMQVFNWVKHNDLKMLEKHGQRLVRKYVNITAIGEWQVLFIDA